MAEVSFLDFPEEEEHDGASEEILTVDSFPYWSQICGSDSDSLFSPHRRPSFAVADVVSGGPSDRIPEPDPHDRNNQVTFVMDLFHQRVEQSHLLGRDEFVSESVNESNLGVIEENRDMGAVNCSQLGLGLGLGLGTDNGWDGDSDDDDDDDDEDEFFIARRETVNCNCGSSLGLGDVLRIVEINSGSDSDSEEGNGLLGIDLHSEGEDYAVDNLDDEDNSNSLCWDSLELQDDPLEPNNDFEWEEVDDGVNEREFLSLMDDLDEEESLSGPEEERIVERGGGLGNLEWEVLPNIVDNVERNLLESGLGPYLSDHDDYSYTQEYELMFGQLVDGENPLLARPPASKSIVENLPSVAITLEDVRGERAHCAICKDQMEVNEEAKQLPCSHWYHGDCILPWLGIRNTCPVCRYELPTDDPDYEQRRSRRAAHQIIVTRIASLDGSDSWERGSLLTTQM